MGTIQTIIIFVIVLGLLVFVHELGHFVAAKRGGVRVDEFGFGFPPRIFGKQWRGTLYSLNWIPLGGFVKIKGVAGDDDEVEKNDKAEDSFATKSFPRKLLILFAGIGMNIVLAAVLFAIVFMIGFRTAPTDVHTGAQVLSSEILIAQVLENGPAQQAGVQPADIVERINGTAITSTEQFQSLVAELPTDGAVTLSVIRGDDSLDINVPVQVIDSEGEQFTGIGVGLQESVVVRYPWYLAIYRGVVTSLQMVWLIFASLIGLIITIFTAGGVGDAVSGPVGIAVLTGQVAESGIVNLLQFVAVLSVNLAIFNLLPIPALDGGRIIFVILEAIRRKPVNQKTEAIVHNVGFMLLLLLVLLVTLKDISQYNLLGFLG